MKVAVLKETQPGELRVAASPETVKKMITLGFAVTLESGAGTSSAMLDTAYQTAGATIAKTAAEAAADADIVLKVQRPSLSSEGRDEISFLKPGAILLAMLDPHRNHSTLEALAKAKIQAFAMEMIPRITRAQGMDVLSSQANLAGYKAVLDAAAEFGRAFPMMMTAAGTVPPARVLIMGAGVAGLQAIATARRLGAIVSATDVRPAAKEQVASLGASFIAVDDEEFRQAETAGGYAKEMSDAYKAKQSALIAETIKKQDIVICTALIPGRPAPRLVDAAMVKSMRPGSVIVDLATDTGGNCELSEPDKVVIKNGVTLIGYRNVPARIPVDASALYARNILAFLTPLYDKTSDAINLKPEDEIVKATRLTADGKIIHPNFLSAPGSPVAKESPVAKSRSPKKPTAKAEG